VDHALLVGPGRFRSEPEGQFLQVELDPGDGEPLPVNRPVEQGPLEVGGCSRCGPRVERQLLGLALKLPAEGVREVLDFAACLLARS
jgi:hypothetical protein